MKIVIKKYHLQICIKSSASSRVVFNSLVYLSIFFYCGSAANIFSPNVLIGLCIAWMHVRVSVRSYRDNQSRYILPKPNHLTMALKILLIFGNFFSLTH